ncbi:MAG TPA: hypothetical protein VF081_06635 [Solirubrobacterales bacterium]
MSSFGLPSLARVSALPADVIGALRQIPEIAENTRAMKDHTAALARVAEQTEVLGQMDARMAAIEEAMPVLVEVQRHLAQLPETMGSLDEGIERLSGLMERILTALDGLNGSVETLQSAVEPMARLASRVPGQKKN